MSIPITKGQLAELAELVNKPRQRIHLELNQMAELGLVNSGYGKVDIVDMAGLKAYVADAKD